MITAKKLKEHISYNPETGVFCRIKYSKWHKKPEDTTIKTLDTDGYIVFKIDGKMYKAHRMAFLYMNGKHPANQVDHINRVKTDNRFDNLRESDCLENNQNKGLQKNNTSGYTGVRFNKKWNKWTAYIYFKKKNIYLGIFDNIDDAIKAREEAKGIYHANTPPAAT